MIENRHKAKQSKTSVVVEITNYNIFLGPPPVGLIVALCIGISVFVVLTFLCFYKGIQWVGEKLKVMKDAEKYLERELHIPTRREGESTGNTNGWTEMQALPEEPIPNIKFSSPSKMSGIIDFSQTKIANNPSMHNNDPMTVKLLPDHPDVTQKPEVIKRHTGGSDTTSGCESGETESLEKDSSGEGGMYDTGTIGTMSTTFDDIGQVQNHRFAESQLPNNIILNEERILKNKNLPRPPKLIESNANGAYVTTPEHGMLAGGLVSNNASGNYQSFCGGNWNGHIGYLSGANPGQNLPSNGYTKAMDIISMPTNSPALRDVNGVPMNLPNHHMIPQDTNLPSRYVITSNSLSNPLPTVIPQLNQSDSLSSSTSGVSSNPPSSQNNHHQNSPNHYVAFSAVPKDTPRPVNQGYVTVAQANTNERIPNITRTHEEGYSRMALPKDGSGPPSLSAAYVQSATIIPPESRVEHLNSNSFYDEDMYQKKHMSNEPSSLVISPNSLLNGHRDDLTGKDSSYNGQNVSMQRNRNNGLNVIASLEGDRQSTMV